MHFASPEKRIWLVTGDYAFVVSLPGTNLLSILALVSWSWVIMNHKRVYSQENARMHFPGLNNAFGGVASIILPCSQPAPLVFTVENH